MCQAWGESAAHSHTRRPPRRATRDPLGPAAGQGPPPPPGLPLPVLGFLPPVGAGGSGRQQGGAERAGGAGAAGRGRGWGPGAGAPGPGFRISGPGSGSRRGAASALGARARAARPPLRAPASPAAAPPRLSPALPEPLPPPPSPARPFLPRRRAPRPRTGPAETAQRRGFPAAAAGAPRAQRTSLLGAQGVAAPGAALPPGVGGPPPPSRRQPRRRPRTPRERRHCGGRADWGPERFFLPHFARARPRRSPL